LEAGAQAAGGCGKFYPYEDFFASLLSFFLSRSRDFSFCFDSSPPPFPAADFEFSMGDPTPLCSCPFSEVYFAFFPWNCFDFLPLCTFSPLFVESLTRHLAIFSFFETFLILVVVFF